MAKRIFLLLAFLFVVLNPVLGYKISPPVHQYLTNESGEVWKLMPWEIKDHLKTPRTQSLDSFGFQQGEDIITGSGEEDTALTTGLSVNTLHFWQPDNPQNGLYEDGLATSTSSYTRAKGFFVTKVIPFYLRGDIDESYYWLGRVVHLLEDAAYRT